MDHCLTQIIILRKVSHQFSDYPPWNKTNGCLYITFSFCKSNYFSTLLQIIKMIKMWHYSDLLRHNDSNHPQECKICKNINFYKNLQLVSCVSPTVTLTPLMVGECVIINPCWRQCQSKITLGEESSLCSIGADKDNSINLTFL